MAEAVVLQPYGCISHAVESVAVVERLRQQIGQVAGSGLGAFVPFLFDTSLHQCGFDQVELAVPVFAWVLLLPPTVHPRRHSLSYCNQEVAVSFCVSAEACCLLLVGCHLEPLGCLAVLEALAFLVDLGCLARLDFLVDLGCLVDLELLEVLVEVGPESVSRHQPVLLPEQLAPWPRRTTLCKRD